MNAKKLDIFIVMTLISVVSCLLLFLPSQTTNVINTIRRITMDALTPFYLWLGFGILVYSIYLSFSKYGKIKFGDEKPDYSTITWLAMIFCTGMGSNLLYWSAIEWIYYYIAPPLNAVPRGQMSAELAATYGGFHWSITGWAIYAIGGITLGLRYYIKKKSGLSLTDCCENVIGEKNSKSLWGRLIELVFLFGTIGSFTTMIAFVVPMYCNNLSILFHITNTFSFQLIFIIIITAIFSISSWTGINYGIKKLSKLNVLLAIALILVIIISGPTMFILKSFTNSIGYMLQNYIYMSLWTDPIGNSGFPEAWTGFYWAWWIGFAPFMWIFIAKISKGRSIQQTVLGVIVSGSIGCWLYFAGVSNYGIYQQITGTLDSVKVLTEQGPAAAASSLVLSFPFGKIFLFIWTLTGIIFLITTMDSGSYTLAVSTTLSLKEKDEPSISLRAFWSIALILIPVGLMFAGAPMETLQTSAILTAIPIAFITIMTIVSGYKYVKEISN